MTISVCWGAATHHGTVREQNEDAILSGPTLFVVADGMGGHAGGEVASSTAVAMFAAVPTQSVSEQDVRDIIDATNDEIRDRVRSGHGPTGMGTTVAGIGLGTSSRVVVFNVGDSRVYRCCASGVEQLSTDHSVVGELVRSGDLDEDGARLHPQRNVLTRALGIESRVQPDVQTVSVSVGDRFLICSDGLFGELAPEELELLGTDVRPPELLAQEVVETVLDRGARDNLSLVVVDVVDVVGVEGSLELDEDTSPSTTVGVRADLVDHPDLVAAATSPDRSVGGRTDG